jgi:hypothetical protein
MATYYFDVQGGGDTEPDRLGREFPNPKMAELEAVRAVVGIGSDALLEKKNQKLAIIVRDESGPVMEVAAAFRIKPLR